MLITLRINIKLLITRCEKWAFAHIYPFFYQHSLFDNFMRKQTFVANAFVDRMG